MRFILPDSHFHSRIEFLEEVILREHIHILETSFLENNSNSGLPDMQVEYSPFDRHYAFSVKICIFRFIINLESKRLY